MPTYTPRTDDELVAVLRNREGPWEYLTLFGVLYTERIKHLDVYRDDRIRFAPAIGDDLTLETGWQRLSNALAEVRGFIDTINALFEERTMEAAVGAPGEPGDADLIVHLGTRIIDNWRSMMDWSRMLRGARVPGSLRPVFQATADLSRAAVGEVHDWVDDGVAAMDGAVDLLAAGQPDRVELELVLTITVDEDAIERHRLALAEYERDLGLS